MRRFFTCVAFAASLVACGAPDKADLPVQLLPMPEPPGPLATVRLAADTAALGVGALRRIVVQGVDRNGTAVSTEKALITSSDASVIALTDIASTSSRDTRTGLWRQELSAMARFVGAGRATLKVVLDGKSDSLVIVVAPRSQAATVLAIESFTMLEFREICAWACPYLVYAPLLRLRASAGAEPVEVVSVEFTLGALTTGVCRGRMLFSPGMSADVNWIDSYLWNNEVIFVSVSGVPLVGNTATARVTIRDWSGVYSYLEATAPVQRLSSYPTLPGPVEGLGWSCGA